MQASTLESVLVATRWHLLPRVAARNGSPTCLALSHPCLTNRLLQFCINTQLTNPLCHMPCSAVPSNTAVTVRCAPRTSEALWPSTDSFNVSLKVNATTISAGYVEATGLAVVQITTGQPTLAVTPPTFPQPVVPQGVGSDGFLYGYIELIYQINNTAPAQMTFDKDSAVDCKGIATSEYLTTTSGRCRLDPQSLLMLVGTAAMPGCSRVPKARVEA